MNANMQRARSRRMHQEIIPSSGFWPDIQLSSAGTISIVDIATNAIVTALVIAVLVRWFGLSFL